MVIKIQYVVFRFIYQSEKNLFFDTIENLHHLPSNHLKLKIISINYKYNYVTFTLKCSEYKSFVLLIFSM